MLILSPSHCVDRDETSLSRRKDANSQLEIPMTNGKIKSIKKEGC